MTTTEEKEILSLLCKVHELEIDKVGCQFEEKKFKLKYLKVGLLAEILMLVGYLFKVDCQIFYG